MDPPPQPRPDDGVDLDLALHHLPVGMFVIDRQGRITAVNEEALRLIGRSREETVDLSILDLVHPQEAQFAADVLSAGPRFPSVISGPIHLRYVTGTGAVAATRMWSRHCLDEEGLDGYVITFGPEAAEESLYRAVLASVTEATPELALGHVVASFSAAPFNATAALITRRAGGGGYDSIGRWPFGPDTLELPGPWLDALDGTATDVIGPTAMAPWLAEQASAAGIGAIWCRPVTTADGLVAAAIVVWRAIEGPPSPNQGLFLDQGAMIAALAIDQAAHRRALERAAFTDPLTGLGNRTRLHRVAGSTDGDPEPGADLARVVTALGGATVESAHPAGVLYVDLDGFKQVNDTLGHAAGDQLLAEVANRFVRSVRSTDEVIRMGGDEFVVLCHDPVSRAGLEALAGRIIDAVAEGHEGDHDGRVGLGASVGIDSDRTLDLHHRIRRADAAMYAAKAAGRGRWHHSGPPADGGS